MTGVADGELDGPGGSTEGAVTRPPPRRADIPTPGWYVLRLVRGGPWVPARITHDPAVGWTVMLNGVTDGPAHDPWTLANMEAVHWGGRPSTEADCKRRLGAKRWAELFDPGHYAANPRKPINLDDITPF